MPVPLIIYSSTDGHTKIICQKIIDSLNDKDTATLISLDEVTKFDLSIFDKIIIGASIRYGKHNKQLYKFINMNKNLLNQKHSIFFCLLYTSDAADEP